MSSIASTCWVLIPVKAPGEGKTRLAGVLDPRVRDQLVAAMLKRVVAAATECPQIAKVCLVSSTDLGLAGDVTLIVDHGRGLNVELASALQMIAVEAPERVIIAAADLPQVEPIDFAMLADVPDHAIAIAPDRHGTGTNALSLPLAALHDFSLQFGLHSHGAHRAEGVRLGYSVETILSSGLEKDIDDPQDLADATSCLQEA